MFHLRKVQEDRLANNFKLLVNLWFLVKKPFFQTHFIPDFNVGWDLNQLDGGNIDPEVFNEI
jgi:hypothetical protein